MQPFKSRISMLAMNLNAMQAELDPAMNRHGLKQLGGQKAGQLTRGRPLAQSRPNHLAPDHAARSAHERKVGTVVFEWGIDLHLPFLKRCCSILQCVRVGWVLG